jgi:hypothetical protein
MLVRIPQLEAQSLYNGYLVNLASTPMADKSGHEMANRWRELASKGVRAFASAKDHTMAAAFSVVRSAFGDSIRE